MRNKAGFMALAAAMAVGGAYAADSILWDLNNSSPINAGVWDFINGGVSEDITEGTVQHITASSNSTMSDTNGITLSYVGSNAKGPYSNGNTSDAILHEYLALQNSTAEMQIGGLTNFLAPSTAYKLYIWGVGDNTGQSSVFTFNGETITLDNSIDPDSNSASNFVAQFSFTTGSTVTNTLDFHWAEQATYGGFNAFAIVEDDGSTPPATSMPPSTPASVYTVISNMAVAVKWDASTSGTAPISYNVKRALSGETDYVTLATLTGTMYVDTTVAVDETYDYVVSATNAIGVSADSDTATGVGLPYDIISDHTSTYGTGSSLDQDNLFDNDTDTYYDTTSPTGGWVGLDFGEGNEQQIKGISYVLRDWTYAYRNGTNSAFEGANSADFSDAEVLYTVPAAVDSNPTVNSASVTNTTAFRYVRLKARDDKPLYSFAEMDFITADEVTAEDTPYEWLDYYYDVSGANPSNFADYAEADYSDTDGDGLLAYQEYKLGGDPTDASSPAGADNLYAWPEAAHTAVVRWDASSIADTANGGGYLLYRSLDSSNYTVVATLATNIYTDTDVTDGVTYYYKASVTNAAYGHETALSDAEAAMVNEYDIIGVMNNSGALETRWFYELFDKNSDTFMDDNTTGGYGGLDYGDGNAKEIDYVGFRLRGDSFGTGYSSYYIDVNGVSTEASRAQYMVYGNTFEGSNDGTTWTVLATITNSVPEHGEWNVVEVADASAYRYVRYYPTSGNNNYAMADVEFLPAGEGFTDNGTLILWLEDYGLAEADDELDTDSDGHAAWQEYVAETDPTDADDVLKITEYSITNGLVLTWQSIEGKSYTIVTNTSLSIQSDGVIDTVIGKDGETSYTGTVSGAGTVFYEIGVE